MNFRNIEHAQGPTELAKDFLLRVREAIGGGSEITIASTSQFINALSDKVSTWLSPLQEDCEILVFAVRQQRRLLEYKDLYISYLGGLIEEKDFETQAAGFTSRHAKNVDHSYLAGRISKLVDLTQIRYSTSELSEIFQVSAEDLAEARPLLSNSEAGSLGKDKQG